MRLAPLDWVVIAVYCIAMVAVGLIYAKRAGSSVDEFFLSGRTLPWWLTGTSMVATSFSIDTPLLITGWVREQGIWKNWAWWCFLVSGMLTVFLFARLWRRGGVMTKAELAELRYGGRDGKLLRGVLGVFHACITNTIILCWVLVAAAKVLDVLAGVDKVTSVAVACVLALAYTLTSGFWGVVLTDLPQFWIAVLGAVALAFVAWGDVGGAAAVNAAAQASGAFPEHALSFLPPAGPGGPFSPSFWTTAVAAVAVYLGVSWWAVENVDGSSASVQRIAASRDERQGMLAVLWFNFAHYALRPWPWVLVALASLVLLPPIELTSPVDGVVREVGMDAIVIVPDATPEAEPVRVPLHVAGTAKDWELHPEASVVPGARVAAGSLIARTDAERAYVTMMGRYLPAGLLGLAIVGLLGAFMSTVDTHINLAASFFVNDVWRRFIRPDASAQHHVLVGRIACVVVMALAGLLTMQAASISDLFMFFLAFLGGVGPVYLARWLWWRVRAAHEIVAMVASAAATMLFTFVWGEGWPDGPLAPGGVLSAEGRLCLVVASAGLCVLLSIPFVPRADPRAVLPFYRRIRPMGWWGPVAALAPGVPRTRELLPVTVGVIGGMASIWGAMIGAGLWLLDRRGEAGVALAAAAAGTLAVWWAVGRLGRVEEARVAGEGGTAG